jgi:hypothetical protein
LQDARITAPFVDPAPWQKVKPTTPYGQVRSLHVHDTFYVSLDISGIIWPGLNGLVQDKKYCIKVFNILEARMIFLNRIYSSFTS